MLSTFRFKQTKMFLQSQSVHKTPIKHHCAPSPALCSLPVSPVCHSEDSEVAGKFLQPSTITPIREVRDILHIYVKTIMPTIVSEL